MVRIGGGNIDTLIVTQEEVAGLLPMDECIDAVRDALAELASGGGLQPLRPIMWLPERLGALGMMPAYLASAGILGVKTISVFPGNEGSEYDSHQGTVMLFDDQDGTLRAIIDATEITAIRTAAASAVATDALARSGAAVLGVLGSGVQARSHIAAMAVVRPLREVRVWSRDPSHADRLARWAASDFPGVRFLTAGSVAEAVAGADIVCTTTAATEPVLPGELLEPGMHVNAVGASVPFARELDGPAMTRATVFTDRRESLLNEAGDFLMAREEGFVSDADIAAEVGEVLVGEHPGRRSDDEITLFKSLGLGVEDVAAGAVVLRNARAAGAGTSIHIGGMRRA